MFNRIIRRVWPGRVVAIYGENSYQIARRRRPGTLYIIVRTAGVIAPS